MSFLWPAALWGLIVLPLVALAVGLAARRRQRTAQAYADAHLLPGVTRRGPARHEGWVSGLQFAALALLLLAASRPVAAVPWPRNEAAAVIALDTSQSMLADDVKPSRFEAARSLAEAFVRQAPAGARIGLVGFSDVASLVLAPTTDHRAVLDALAGLAPASNTSLTAAVLAGVRLLPGREHVRVPAALDPSAASATSSDAHAIDRAVGPPPGSLLVLSDGVSNVEADPALPQDASLSLVARFAADNGVRVFTVPFGRDGGAVTTIAGTPYFIPYQPDTLRSLAEESQGDVLDPNDEAARRELFRQLGVAIRWRSDPREMTAPLAALAMAGMLTAGALALRWQRRVP